MINEMNLKNYLNIMQIKYRKDFSKEQITLLTEKMLSKDVNTAEARKEIYRILAMDRETGKKEIDNLFKKYNVPKQKLDENELKEKNIEIKNALNMDNITEFKAREKNYMKITLKNGDVRILENMENLNVDVIFARLQEEYNIKNPDGVKNSEDIFNVAENYKIEAQLRAEEQLAKDKLKEDDLKEFDEVKKVFPHDTIYSAPERGIYINKSRNNMLIEVKKLEGKLVVSRVAETTYKEKSVNVINDDDMDLSNLSLEDIEPELVNYDNTVEVPEDVQYETAINEGGISEEQAFSYLKEQKLKKSQIIRILAYNRKLKKLNKPKQLVLKKEPNAFTIYFTLPLIIIMISAISIMSIVLKLIS